MKHLRVSAIIHPQYQNLKEEITKIINAYDEINTYIYNGSRNSIKLATLSNGQKIAIKSFKIPNIINRYVYKLIRKPKGLRSYEHSERLNELGINSPQAIAYFEYTTNLTLRNSFYVSEYVDAELTYRDLLLQSENPNREKILKEFIDFTYQLHEKKVKFLDHSPGNTLIKQNEDGTFSFYLVDVNRMKFNKEMNFTKRMKNLSHLTTNIDDIEKMASHYAHLIGKNSFDVFLRLWLETIKFQFRFYKKKDLKNKIKKMYYHE
ncbi:Kdo domain containing protein [Myroides albus]|uniref:lipopolysaccharide kinase InaA family protein n=1 Tax=Myroides albus TaxID=2562892 RepID=UPI002158E7E8|nr:lipopolysaccharide kinase InaA family protein [Myroides albus]UVD80883.1 Kdo domain containing protein [Myroides albus]